MTLPYIFVIPAQAGIYMLQVMDSRLRGNDAVEISYA